jgi:glycosyltransferase involved in cell wall biosynthesis
MKIALLNQTLGRSRGGVEAWMFHVAQALRELGTEPILMAPHPVDIASDAAPPGVRTVWLDPPGSGPVLLRGRRRMRSYRQQLRDRCGQTDVFISRCPLLAEAAAAVADGRPVAFVHANAIRAFYRACNYGQGVGVSWPQRLTRWARSLRAARQEARAMDRCDTLVYLSASRRRATVRGRYRQFADKACVVPPGVDLQRFAGGQAARVSRGPLGLLSVCRLSPEKNLNLLADAIYLLKRQGVRVSWEIAGEGPFRGELERRIARLGIGDRVRLLGRRSDVEHCYAKADLFVLPSTYEGFGHVYLEALAGGVPCIALSGTQTGLEVAADEILRHDRTGWLLDRNHPDALAEILMELTRDRARLARWSREARNDAQDRFRWSLSVRRLLGAARVYLPTGLGHQPSSKEAACPRKKAS